MDYVMARNGPRSSAVNAAKGPTPDNQNVKEHILGRSLTKDFI